MRNKAKKYLWIGPLFLWGIISIGVLPKIGVCKNLMVEVGNLEQDISTRKKEERQEHLKRLYGLFEAAYAEGQFDKARKELLAILDIVPKDEKVKKLLLQLNFEQESYVKKDNIKKVTLRQVKETARLKAKQAAEKQAQQETARQVQEAARRHYLKGKELYLIGEYLKAKEELKKSIELTTRYEKGIFKYLANCEKQLNQEAESKAKAEKNNRIKKISGQEKENKEDGYQVSENLNKRFLDYKKIIKNLEYEEQKLSDKEREKEIDLIRVISDKEAVYKKNNDIMIDINGKKDIEQAILKKINGKKEEWLRKTVERKNAEKNIITIEKKIENQKGKDDLLSEREKEKKVESFSYNGEIIATQTRIKGILKAIKILEQENFDKQQRIVNVKMLKQKKLINLEETEKFNKSKTLSLERKIAELKLEEQSLLEEENNVRSRISTILKNKAGISESLSKIKNILKDKEAKQQVLYRKNTNIQNKIENIDITATNEMISAAKLKIRKSQNKIIDRENNILKKKRDLQTSLDEIARDKKNIGNEIRQLENEIKLLIKVGDGKQKLKEKVIILKDKREKIEQENQEITKVIDLLENQKNKTKFIRFQLSKNIDVLKEKLIRRLKELKEVEKKLRELENVIQKTKNDQDSIQNEKESVQDQWNKMSRDKEVIHKQINDRDEVLQEEKNKADEIEEKLRVEEKVSFEKRQSLEIIEKEISRLEKLLEDKKNEQRELVTIKFRRDENISDLVKEKAEKEIKLKELINKKEDLMDKEYKYNSLQEDIKKDDRGLIKENFRLKKLEEEVRVGEERLKTKESLRLGFEKKKINAEWQIQKLREIKEISNNLQEAMGSVENEVIKEKVGLNELEEEVKLVEANIKEQEARVASLVKERIRWSLQQKELVKTRKALKLVEGQIESLEEKINNIDRKIIKEMVGLKKIEEESIVLAKVLNQRENRKAELKKEKIEIEFRGKEIIQSGDYVKSVEDKVQRQENGIKGLKDKIISFEQESKGIEKDIILLKNKILKIQKEKSKMTNKIDMLKGLQQGQEKDYESIVINGFGVEEKIRIEIEKKLIPTKVQDIYKIWKIEKQKADKIEEKMRIKEKEILKKSKSLVILDKELVFLYKQEEDKKDEYRALLNSTLQMEKVFSDLIKFKAETELIAKRLGNKKEELRKKEAAIQVLEKEKIKISLTKDKTYLEGQVEKLEKLNNNLAMTVVQGKGLEKEIESWGVESLKVKAGLDNLNEKIKYLSKSIKEKENRKASLEKEKLSIRVREKAVTPIGQDLWGVEAKREKLEHELGLVDIDIIQEKAELNRLEEIIRGLEENISQQESNKLILENDKIKVGYQEQELTKINKELRTLEDRISNLKDEITKKEKISQREDKEIKIREKKIDTLKTEISVKKGNAVEAAGSVEGGEKEISVLRSEILKVRKKLLEVKGSVIRENEMESQKEEERKFVYEKLGRVSLSDEVVRNKIDETKEAIFGVKENIENSKEAKIRIEKEIREKEKESETLELKNKELVEEIKNKKLNVQQVMKIKLTLDQELKNLKNQSELISDKESAMKEKEKVLVQLKEKEQLLTSRENQEQSKLEELISERDNKENLIREEKEMLADAVNNKQKQLLEKEFLGEKLLEITEEQDAENRKIEELTNEINKDQRSIQQLENVAKVKQLEEIEITSEKTNLRRQVEEVYKKFYESKEKGKSILLEKETEEQRVAKAIKEGEILKERLVDLNKILDDQKLKEEEIIEKNKGLDQELLEIVNKRKTFHNQIINLTKEKEKEKFKKQKFQGQEQILKLELSNLAEEKEAVTKEIVPLTKSFKMEKFNEQELLNKEKVLTEEFDKIGVDLNIVRRKKLDMEEKQWRKEVSAIEEKRGKDLNKLKEAESSVAKANQEIKMLLEEQEEKTKQWEALERIRKARVLTLENNLKSASVEDQIKKEMKRFEKNIFEAKQKESIVRKKLVQERLSYHYNLALSYDQGQKYEQAVVEYKKALGINPNDPDVNYNLAVIYDDYLGDNKKAIKHYQNYLKYSPGAEDAEKVLNWINWARQRINLNETVLPFSGK